jgi:hypothetical protein
MPPASRRWNSNHPLEPLKDTVKLISICFFFLNKKRGGGEEEKGEWRG